MQVGDLVKKKTAGSVGIITSISHSDLGASFSEKNDVHYKTQKVVEVLWADIGEFWTSAKTLEVINEDR